MNKNVKKFGLMAAGVILMLVSSLVEEEKRKDEAREAREEMKAEVHAEVQRALAERNNEEES